MITAIVFNSFVWVSIMRKWFIYCSWIRILFIVDIVEVSFDHYVAVGFVNMDYGSLQSRHYGYFLYWSSLLIVCIRCFDLDVCKKSENQIVCSLLSSSRKRISVGIMFPYLFLSVFPWWAHLRLIPKRYDFYIVFRKVGGLILKIPIRSVHVFGDALSSPSSKRSERSFIPGVGVF